MLAPARMPVAAGKKMAKTEKNVSPRKSGPMFSHIIEPEKKIEIKKQWRRPSGKSTGIRVKEKNLIGKQERKKVCVGTVVAEVAVSFLGLEGDEGPNEVVDDGSDQHKQQEDLGLHGARIWFQ